MLRQMLSLASLTAIFALAPLHSASANDGAPEPKPAQKAAKPKVVKKDKPAQKAAKPKVVKKDKPAQSLPSRKGIHETFTEWFTSQTEGVRYKIRNVKLVATNDVVGAFHPGAPVEVSLELLHDCPKCEDAFNQVIAGWSGEKTARICIWNGMQRSGGGTQMAITHDTDQEVLAENNPGPAEWVTIKFEIPAPSKAGVYELRTRYAQAWGGTLHTLEANNIPQTEYPPVLNWWTVDRPTGPKADATIAKIVVQP